jgi:YidC/Oxa1 family membrane protein insertase
MSLFDTLIVQPIFNLLALIYGLLPGSDFGISLILFTIIVRLLMWPLVRKQLHQTKLMRGLQPELKKIKARAKGNRQIEAQLMMELYRERGVKPFSSIGLLFLQLPIFIALYSVIQIITTNRDEIARFTYSVVEQLQPIATIINNRDHSFDTSLLGLVDLAKVGLSNDGIYWPVIVIAAIAAGLQYIQSKQITPQADSKKKLRDIFKESAAGKEVDQSEMSAIMTNRMIVLFPFLTFIVGLYLPGALVLYFATSSAVAVIQQHMLLNQDVEEMEVIADMVDTKDVKKSSTAAKKRAASATEATVTSPAKKSRKKKRRR